MLENIIKNISLPQNFNIRIGAHPEIIKKLPFDLPELPDGYQWAGGYPQFREPKIGEYYLGMSDGETFLEKNNVSYISKNWRDDFIKQRLIIEKIPAIKNEYDHAYTSDVVETELENLPFSLWKSLGDSPRLNYWLIEPAINILKSTRYAVPVMLLAYLFCWFFAPDLLPKISIKFD